MTSSAHLCENLQSLGIPRMHREQACTHVGNVHLDMDVHVGMGLEWTPSYWAPVIFQAPCPQEAQNLMAKKRSHEISQCEGKEC